MTDKDEPEQIVIMKRMLELAQQQADLSVERTRMAAERSRMSEDRSRLSEDRSRMSAERSEMSETRSYHNAERTLSAWVRTALSLMVFGIAIDRFGLLLQRIPGSTHGVSLPRTGLLEPLSSGAGAGLVLLATLMTASCGVRFFAFARAWRQHHTPPVHHGPYLATFFALAVTLFGILLLIFMAFFTD